MAPDYLSHLDDDFQYWEGWKPGPVPSDEDVQELINALFEEESSDEARVSILP